MDFDLTEDQRAIEDAARAFAAAELAPHSARWDEDKHFPVDVLRKAAELGFAGLYVREDVGGSALSRLDASIVFEALSYGDVSVAAFISIHNMASWMIAEFGSEALKRRFLPRLVGMQEMASYCLTEPGAGSDAAALTTRAVRDGDHYVLNGSKAFISGAGDNEIYVCMVRTGGEGHRGISCLVVEKDTPGVSFGAPERKMGWHSQATAMVIFEDARVPVENRVGEEGQGFAIAMAGLDGGRLNIGACSLGGAQRCFDEAVGYVKERRQFGRAIAEFQNTQFMLADMLTELEAARALLYKAAQKVSEDAPDKTQYAAMAKLKATEAGSRIANHAMQLHGGYGYLMDYPIERFVRDLRVHEILEGTSQIMRLVIGRRIVG